MTSIEAWASPLLTGRVRNASHLNKGLKRLILGEQLVSPGMTASNVGAWQSEPMFLTRSEPEILALNSAIYECAAAADQLMVGSDSCPEFALEGWALVYGPGHYADLHVHHDAVWSGVYYVEMGAGAGAIEFVDPRTAARARFEPSSRPIKIQPEPGRILLFPGWLAHSVRAQAAGGLRISIAFNVGVVR